MPKALKPQSKQKKERTVKPNVVSFRMSEAQYKRLEAMSKSTGVLGASSPRQFARKIVCDFLLGRMKYNNPNDLRKDTENYK